MITLMKIISNCTILVLSFVSISGCSRSNTLLGGIQVADPKVKWQSYKLASYSIEQRFRCFCGPAAIGWIRIEVVNDEIVNAIGISSGDTLDSAYHNMLYTVDGVFRLIDTLKEGDPVLLVIEYDDRYGFPAKIDYDLSLRIIDEELRLEMRELKAGEP